MSSDCKDASLVDLRLLFHLIKSYSYRGNAILHEQLVFSYLLIYHVALIRINHVYHVEVFTAIDNSSFV